MSWQRDLGWENAELMNRSSVAYNFARYALGLNYEKLPQDVVHQAKRCLLDTLGCATGAYDSPGRPICEDVAKELGGPEEATVIGSGLRTSAPNVTLVNSFLVRFLDSNDLGMTKGSGGHPSDGIPGILAVAEREKADGRDFLTSLVIHYELQGRVLEGIVMKERPEWCTEITAGLSMPPALGRLMGLNEEQIANAMGICASGSVALGILDAAGEELVNRKNLRFGFVSHNAILSCMLAQKGFTGPVRIVEGDKGMAEVIFRVQGEVDLQRMTDFSGWRTLSAKLKSFAAGHAMMGVVSAALTIVKERDLKPEDIAAVHIKGMLPEARHIAWKYPRNGENADHSVWYMVAAAIKERSMGPELFQPEKFTDPVILGLIDKMTLEVDPSMPKGAGITQIVTKDGRKFEEQTLAPRVFLLNDEEVQDKFRGMASKYMDEKQIQKIFDAVWNAEELDDINKLMSLMVFPSR